MSIFEKITSFFNKADHDSANETEKNDNIGREMRLYPKTYLAPGSVLKGSIRTKGNIEIAGEFTGDIVSESDVLVSANINSNISAVNITLNESQVNGDVKAVGALNVSDGSAVIGDVEARDIVCNGHIEGNIKVTNHISLGDNAVIDGSITTGTISMVRGATFHGTVEMTDSSAQ